MDNTTFRSHRQLALFSFLLVIAVAALVTPTVVSAQGLEPDRKDQITGFLLLGEEVAGPYLLEIHVSPILPTEGILRFAVRVRDAETGEDIDGAIVRVFGTPSEKGEKQYSPALNSPFDPIFYLAQLEFENAGIWAVDIEVESELGVGSTVLSLQVRTRTRGATGTGLGTALYLLVTLAIVGGGAWLLYSSKKARAAQGPRKSQKL